MGNTECSRMKMISATSKNGELIELSVDPNEVAAVNPDVEYSGWSDIILKSGHIVTGKQIGRAHV